MKPEETITLRAAGLGLRTRKGSSKNSPDDAGLLGALRTNDLSAGFYFNISGRLLWVSIPEAYWHAVTSAQFSCIRVVKKTRKNGTFLISGKSVAKSLARVVAENVKGNDVEEGIYAILNSSDDEHEVVIKSSEWNRYIATVPEGFSKAAAKGGRREKESWKQLCPIIAVYFVELMQSKEPIKIEAVTAEIERRARNISDMPRTDTLKDVMSRIVNDVREFRSV